jgi:hypothetical protein
VCIFGTLGKNIWFGPFIPGELEPVNESAVKLMAEVDALEQSRTG